MIQQIIVCIKAVPVMPGGGAPAIDPVSKTVQRAGLEQSISSLDRYAIEAAVQIKAQTEATVSVVSMGPPEAKIAMMEALALGADAAYLCSDRLFAGGDTLATSHLLAEAIRRLGAFDLILCGAHSDDGGTAQVPAQLAEWLGLPHLHGVTELAAAEEGVMLTVKDEQGLSLWQAQPPLLLSLERRPQKPRPARLRGIRLAKTKPLNIWGAADLPACTELVGLSGSPTQFGELKELQGGRNCQMITGDTATLVAEILAKLAQHGLQV